MRDIDGWFLLFQPKYRIPSVFDLHQRGLFQEKPGITMPCGARMLVNDGLQVALEYRVLKEDRNVVKGIIYSYATSQGILILNADLAIDISAVSSTVRDFETEQEISRVYEQFCKDYLPTNKRGQFDNDALQCKLRTSLGEAKKQYREELKRKNGTWVASRVPALTGRFFLWQEGQVAEELFDAYRVQRGEDTPTGLITKIAQFYTICNTTEPDGLERLDGKNWTTEDEIWQCWVGFAGSDEEANRIFQVMERVFRHAE